MEDTKILEKQMIQQNLREQMIKNHRDKWFVSHIQNHLDNGDIGNCPSKITPMKVGCSICGKDIDQIAEDTMQEIEKLIRETRF